MKLLRIGRFQIGLYGTNTTWLPLQPEIHRTPEATFYSFSKFYLCVWARGL